MTFHSTRRALGFCCLLGMLAVWTQPVQGVERQLFMSVVNQSGQPITDITVDEVVLEQEGGECTIRDFSLDSGPMKVALLVDTSDAAAQSLNSMRDGLSAFLDELPPEHEVGLFTIAGQVRRRTDFTTTRRVEEERRACRRPETAVVYWRNHRDLERRYDEEDAWPVFVALVYDGAEGSRSTQEDEFNEFAVELVGRAATVHAILVSTRGGALQTTISTFLTGNTGGMYRALAAATALPETFGELAAAMAAQHDAVKDRYRLVYECDPDNPTAGIGAGVSRPAVAVRLFPDRRTDR